VVEVGRFVVTMTTQKDFQKERSMATHSGKAKKSQNGGQFGSSPSFSTKQGQGVCWTCGAFT